MSQFVLGYMFAIAFILFYYYKYKLFPHCMLSEPHYNTSTKNRFIGAVENSVKQCKTAKFYEILPSVANHIWKKF
jgi:hypothetical protein